MIWQPNKRQLHVMNSEFNSVTLQLCFFTKIRNQQSETKSTKVKSHTYHLIHWLLQSQTNTKSSCFYICQSVQLFLCNSKSNVSLFSELSSGCVNRLVFSWQRNFSLTFSRHEGMIKQQGRPQIDLLLFQFLLEFFLKYRNNRY